MIAACWRTSHLNSGKFWICSPSSTKLPRPPPATTPTSLVFPGGACILGLGRRARAAAGVAYPSRNVYTFNAGILVAMPVKRLASATALYCPASTAPQAFARRCSSKTTVPTQLDSWVTYHSPRPTHQTISSPPAPPVHFTCSHVEVYLLRHQRSSRQRP
jgi:hypothetical protein